MDNKYDNFLKILTEYEPKDMMDFLLSKGKSPKPICPIIFINNKNEEIKE